MDGVLLGRQGRRRQTQGNPTGHRPDQAKVEWARLERRAPPKPSHLMSYVFDRYEKEIIPGKSIRTQSDNHKELKQLRRAFESAPIESITPQVIAQYRDARTAKVRANREIALLSHAFTIAREWGLTDKANPCFGVRRNKEKPRDYYAGETVWNAVYAEAAQELKDAMDLAYLTGQRPADVLKIAATDLNNGFLLIGQGKTEKRLRLRLEEEGVQSGLSAFIEDLQERRAINGIRTSTPLLRLRIRYRHHVSSLQTFFSSGSNWHKKWQNGSTSLTLRISQGTSESIRTSNPYWAPKNLESSKAAQKLELCWHFMLRYLNCAPMIRALLSECWCSTLLGSRKFTGKIWMPTSKH